MTRGTHVLFALAAATLAACSEPRAGSLPPPTAPPSSASAPSATPLATASPDAAGALVGAATAFYDTLERAARDPGRGAHEVRRLVHRSCECTRIVAFLRDQASSGRRIERPVIVVEPTATMRGDGGTVFLTLRQGAGRVIGRDGRVVERLEPTVDRVVIDFRRVGGVLLVTQIASRRS